MVHQRVLDKHMALLFVMSNHACCYDGQLAATGHAWAASVLNGTALLAGCFSLNTLLMAKLLLVLSGKCQQA
jgi:hypothetical protein